MARKSTKPRKAVIAGKRVGTKSRDTRWLAEDGTIWASRFEYAVYSTLKDKGYDVRKTCEQDRMAYASVVANGRCRGCDSTDVVAERHYTPDLFVVPKRSRPGSGVEDPTRPGTWGYYLEAKGYLRAERRTLLRAFRKTGPSCDLRLVVQRDYPVGKSTLTGWANRLLKVPVTVWDGKELPEDWR
jgi:hypothetical protein